MPRHSEDPFTEKREEVYRYIVRFVEVYGTQPAIREIGEALGIVARAAHDRIKGLRKAGLIGSEVTQNRGDRNHDLIGLQFKAYRVNEDGSPKDARVVTIDDVKCIVIPLPTDHPLRKFDTGISLETGDVPLISVGNNGDEDDGEAGEGGDGK